MDDASYPSSQRIRQLQGPCPPRLAVSKDSHKIKKPVIIDDASPKLIHTTPGNFMAVVHRFTGQGAAPAYMDLEEPSAAPPVRFQPPLEFARSPTAALSPAARLAAIERAFRLLPLPTPSDGADALVAADIDTFAAVLDPPGRPGILSPALLPPVASFGQLLPLPVDPRGLSCLSELLPILHTAGTRVEEGLGGPFALNQRRLLLATPTMPSAAPPVRFQPPLEFARSPTAALSPAARLPAIEGAIRPLPLPTPSYGADAFVSADIDSFAAVLGPPGRPGILSPAALPPAVSSWQFSQLPFNASCLSWLSEVFPFLHTGGARVEGLGGPFALKQQGLLLATPAMLSPATLSILEFFCNAPDIKSGHGEEAPARPVGDAKRRGEAEPAGDLQVGVDSGSIRRFFQQLVHVRTTTSSSSGALLCDAWFNNVKHLSSDAEKSLEDLHYKMILAMLGVGRHRKKVMSNVSGTCSKTASINFTQLSSPEELAILSIIDKLESLEYGRSGLSGAVLGNYSDIVSLSSLVMRCILLCRGVLGIVRIVGTEGMKETLELPGFAFDDLAYAGHNKGIGMNRHSIPPRVTDPIYLLPIFIRSLLYLDLSTCSSLTHLPPSISNLHNLAALNLSHCYSLRTLPVSLGRLKNLQILVLSCCHELRYLPVSLRELSKLRLLDLSGCSSLENLPHSLVNLVHLENLNLSDCKELKELPQPFGNLQELKYLNLSGSHGVDLDVWYLCKLVNLKCLTLSPLTNIQGFPDSFRELANRLDRLRWWKKNHVHPQCNPEAASLHSYRCYEQSIIDRVLSDEDDISSDEIVTYICIVGESGMGKTELVRRIYSNRMILDTFNLRIWLYMCDKKRLLGKIVEFTTGAYCTDAQISVLEEIVIEELTGKRFLLVLDDSDNKSQYFWSYVRRLLNVCAKGSALIVTTKSNEVANLVGAMQTCYLSPVSKEECFIIFKGHVLGGLDMNSYPQLESIGWKVVEKSGGNPMCIKVLSGLLCHSEIGLSEIDMLLDGILPALRLCYDLLPAHLQQCFKFCSLFPKYYIFIKHHIIQLWIAQGFVFPEEGSQPEDTGLHYFDELFCRSFFQRSPFHNDQEDMFVMHELFHDLAYSVSRNECFRCEEPFCSLPENISHLSLVLSDFRTLALAKEARNLQSFLIVRRSFPVVRILNSNDLYVKYRFLRALDLSYMDILELPSSIGNMKHLRYLALNNTKIKDLPFEIGQVDTLQTLELKNCCHLIDLPGSTSNLVKLRHLDVRKEPGNVKVGMPHDIGQLTELQTLTVFNIGNDLMHCSIGDLKNLNGLRGHVHITGLENIKTANDAREANIIGKRFLEALTLEWSYSDEGMEDDTSKEIANGVFKNLQPNRILHQLVIQNYAGNLFPLWMQDSYLCKLVSITLDNCYNCSELPCLYDLPSLKSLFIQRMNAIESFGTENNSVKKHQPRFPSLEVLNLWEMYDLKFWVGTREGDFPRLFRLSISRCPNLTNLPRLISLVHLSFHCGGQLPALELPSSLESLKIEGFHKIRSISFPRQLTTLKKLEISDCKELLSIKAHSLSVSDLKVVRCLKLDLVGSSLEDRLAKKIVGGRNSTTRRSMVLKTSTYTNLKDDGWKWEKFGEKNIFGYIFPRSYYRCMWRNSTGCSATKILQPNNNYDLNTLFFTGESTTAAGGARAPPTGCRQMEPLLSPPFIFEDMEGNKRELEVEEEEISPSKGFALDPTLLSVMYISEHNHEFPNEPHLESPVQLGTTRKRKESDVYSDEHTSKRQLKNLR